MKREKISEALGSISSRHIKEAAEFKAEEKPHRRKNAWVKWGAIAACLCLIMVAALAVIPMLNPSHGGGDELIDHVLPTDIDKIIWSSHSGSVSESDDGHMLWNGFPVGSNLYDALQEHPDEYIAVVVTKADGTRLEEAEGNNILDALINRAYKHGDLYIFITREQFANWNMENKYAYFFLLASRDHFEGLTNQPQPPQIDDLVTGFDLSKIGLSNVDGCRTGAIANEEELYAALNELAGQWEHLMITIGSDNPIDQSELEEMNYTEVQHWKYPTRTVVFVDRSRLNMEALKELTLREDVSFVWVTEQLVPTDDNADVGPTPEGD